MDQTLNNALPEYTGTVQPEPDFLNEQGQRLYPYLPDEALIEAVNLALYLQRPLLLRGEPGCGKTRLASAVAFELGLPYKEWHIKSTSRARDGLYFYDAVGRLRDAQLAATDKLTAIETARVRDPEGYIRWGALGQAFREGKKTVVLIDEIDKADLDFPNDLLLELDEQRFVVEETGQPVRAEHPPLVIITSNDEKELPDAFLRRCLFHYVKFPKPEKLTCIVQAHFPAAEEQIIEAAVGRFLTLRREISQEKGEAGKNVSTSELLDWFRVLLARYPQDQIVARLEEQLPFGSVLLKSWDDQRRYLKRSE
jgi:MoxR-like ATPase